MQPEENNRWKSINTHADSCPVKKEVFIIGDSMIIHVNGREVSHNDSGKLRSHPDDFIDYVLLTVPNKNKFDDCS